MSRCEVCKKPVKAVWIHQGWALCGNCYENKEELFEKLPDIYPPPGD